MVDSSEGVLTEAIGGPVIGAGGDGVTEDPTGLQALRIRVLAAVAVAVARPGGDGVPAGPEDGEGDKVAGDGACEGVLPPLPGFALLRLHRGGVEAHQATVAQSAQEELGAVIVSPSPLYSALFRRDFLLAGLEALARRIRGVIIL